jgi:hypothetical protein
MIAVVIIFCSVLIAFIRGGRLSNLNTTILRCPYLVIASFVVEFLIRQYGNTSAWAILAAFVVQYLLLFIFIAFNIKQRYMKMIGLGVLSNFVVILFNGGAMPVSQRVLEIPSLAKQADMLKSGVIPYYVLMSPETPLWFLGDVIYIPLFKGQFISIGDIIMIAGIFLLIQHIMLSNSTTSTELGDMQASK